MAINASDFDIEIKEAAPTQWIYKNENGELSERTESKDERDQCVVPPPGMFNLKILAFSRSFEMPKSMEFGGGTSTNTRLLCEIVPPTPRGVGKKLTLLSTWALSKNSNLGRVYTAATGIELRRGEKGNPVNLLGETFQVYLKQDAVGQDGKPSYNRPSWDTVKPAAGGEEAVGADDNWDE